MPSEPTQTLHPAGARAQPAGFEPGPVPPAPESPGALSGRRLGEYVVRGYIGSGGMGVVYEGEHATIGRKVAIKLIREELTRGPHARDLLTEARAASAIRHHGIIDVHGFGHEPGVGQYLVMEFLEGHSLDRVIQKRAPFTLAEAGGVLCEVLDALSAAHAEGVIHRDLKPSNIFIARQSNGAEYVKVLDFGLAKRTDVPHGTTSQTHSSLIVGTPLYMAPEQARGEAVGPRTDLYAVGVIAFELLTGKRPFSGRSPMEIVAHHLRSPPPAPSSLVELPPEADALVLRLLAKEPHQRPSTAIEVAEALRALLPQGARSSPTPARRFLSTLPPASGVATADATTATLPPPPGDSRPPGALAPQGARRRWSAAAGGLLALALGAGLMALRGPTEPVPAAASAPPVGSVPPATQQAPTAPAVGAPGTELQAPPAREPAPVATTHPGSPVRTAPAARKRKAPVAAQPSVATAAAPPPPTASPEPAPERAAAGTLHLTVKGAWADVWVDDQLRGSVPPLHSYPLPAGEHVLELRNPAFPPYRRKVVIPPNGSLSHTVDFTSPAQDSSEPDP
ncbi:serine/threonine-protein kinase [Pyxidicoccus fallax]|nr:serine/threonine-protein kinase [Pyxidicoccus fallax]